MKCQSCGAAEATVHIKEVRNDQVSELHLCEKCAREKGYHSLIDKGKFSLANQFILMAESLYPQGTAGLSSIRCSECGLTYSDFMQTYRLGCPCCYTDFEKQLKQVLRRVHGAVRHVGKAPGREGGQFERRRELQKLHEDLERAIEREEYERAAQIRDAIRSMESGAAAGKGDA